MKLYKLVVLGPGGVGKTAFVIQMMLNHFTEFYDPTIEDSYRKQVTIDNEPCILEVLDTAGQEEYSALRDQWIRDSEAAILMYSSSSRDSFTKVSEFHSEILLGKDLSAPDPMSMPIVLVAHKSDKYEEREVSTAEGFALANELGCKFIESSAKNCINVQKAFYDLVRELRRQQLEKIRPSKLNIPNSPPERRSTNSTPPGRVGYLTTFFRRFNVGKVNIREEYKYDVAHQLAIDKVLIQAARLGDLRAVKKCVMNGANPNAQPGLEGSALHASVALGHAKIVKFLLANGAAPNAKAPREMTTLQIASAEGHRDVVKLLLKARADVNTSSSLHGTALLAAASRGQVEVARTLIKHGADVNAKGGQYGNPLQTAAVVGKAEMARILLDAGASVHARGKGGCTALQAACNAGHTNIVRLLRDYGADVNAPGGIFGTALEAANGTSRFDVFDLLLSYGASVDDLKVSRLKAQDVSASSEGGSGDTQRPENGGLGETAANPTVLDGHNASGEDSHLDSSQGTGSTEIFDQSVAINVSGPPKGQQSTSLSIRNTNNWNHTWHHSEAGSERAAKSSSFLDWPDWPLPASPPLLREGLPEIANKSSETRIHVPNGSFKRSHRDYTVACICPMAIELAPVEAMLDEIHPTLPTTGARNAYTFGSMGGHNVIIAVMPVIGNNSAAGVATQLMNDFPEIRFALLVGIGGGIPGQEDIRLGDVVVSKPTATFGGVVQYDIGKSCPNGMFQRIGTLAKPPPILSGTVEKLRAQHLRSGNKIQHHLSEMFHKYPNLANSYMNPGPEHDLLFEDGYAHQGGSTCSSCDPAMLAVRANRTSNSPQVHYGTIGSANALVRDSVTRNRLGEDLGILCVEMEAAGLMDIFPCLVIRGICDYADSHKNNRWQLYAAAVAAGYMREILLMIPPQDVATEAHAVSSGVDANDSMTLKIP